MDPIKFPEVNVTWAENQPEYRPLPAFVDERHTITCWRLTFLERLVLLFRGRFWLTQLNFGRALQPILPTVETPFDRPKLPKLRLRR